MSSWPQIYYKLLNLPLSILVKSKSIPADPAPELGLDTSHPIMYILPYNSKADLLTLHAQCLAHDLPDPLEPLEINSTLLPRYVFIHSRPRVFTYYTPKEESIKLFHNYLNLHHSNPNLDVQMVPVSVMFGHAPGHEKGKVNPPLHMLNSIQKFFTILWLSHDSFVHFSPSVSLRHMADEHSTDKTITQKLAHMAHMHFAHQHLAAVGPHLPAHQDLFNKLLTSHAIAKAVEDEARSKKISHEKAQQNTIALMEEIAANFSYKMIHLTDHILGFTWNHLYQGINIHNTKHVHQLAHNSHELVYVPCHHSHMDYLLLSYMLYHQGLVPPHITTGINLNFWPARPIFHHLGAFFIHHTFKGNKLYSTIFHEYLSELFSHGYSIKYFMEGSHSHTGHLLDPKTSTLSMTIQAMLHGSTRPITLIPIYISYEHIMEVGTYTKELHSTTKEKESLPQMLHSLSKLHNLSQGYINFSEPMPLMTYLNQHIPDWHESINPIKAVHPAWLTPTVNNIAANLMVHINNTGTANTMNLCCTALLASHQHSLTHEQLTKQLNCYLDLMHNIPYSTDSTIPSASASKLINHTLQMNKFEVKKDTISDIIILPRKQAVLMTYYHNNIAHMLVLPSLMAAIITQHRHISHDILMEHINVLYPMLKAELFLHWDHNKLPDIIDALANEMQHQGLITLQDDELHINPAHSHTLQLLATGTRETLQHYAITFWLLSANPSINHSTLEKESHTITQHLSMLHSINAPEFFNKAVFSSLVLTLHDEGYISNSSNAKPAETMKVYQLLAELITSDMHLTIESATQGKG